MKSHFLTGFALLILIASGCKQITPVGKAESGELYSENLESLFRHNAEPEWFKDAKLGIYFHWGVYSVPAFGNEWYPRWMHFEYEGLENYRNDDIFPHHVKTYGHPSEFGYHDFIPIFRAEYFDAEEWADLFKKAGARFAGPVAEHHDGFSMWASNANPWNSMDMGPQKDITGQLAQAVRARDMKFITTFHHARHLQRYADNPGERRFRDSHYPYIEGMPTVSTDEKLRILYGNIPEDEWLENLWFPKLKEVIDQYQPDIIWFDSWLDRIPDEYLRKFLAYYFNQAAMWGEEVVVVRKQEDLPLEVSVNDLEKSRMNRTGTHVWMSDETVSTGSWSYTDDLVIKDPTDLIHVLIDITSKNGVLLLNISPKANGIIPEDQRQVLLMIGKWLEEFGESIYDTRPWYTFGEGPTVEPEGHFSNRQEFLNLRYSSKDVRYTTREDYIYAILMGWPGSGSRVNLQAFAKENLPDPLNISQVVLLGSDEEISWSHNDDGLVLVTPQKMSNERAVVFRIAADRVK